LILIVKLPIRFFLISNQENAMKTLATIILLTLTIFSSAARADACSGEREKLANFYSQCQSYNEIDWGDGIDSVIAEFLRNEFWLSGEYSIFHCAGMHDGKFVHSFIHPSGFLSSCIAVSPPPQQRNTTGCSATGSIIHITDQVVGETIPVVGAPFELVYFSDRVTGRKESYIARITISRSQISDAVTGYNIQIKDEAGTILDNTDYAPAADITHLYEWNGLDSSSVETWGKARRTVTISETATDYSFPPQTSDISIGGLKAKKLGIGGWLPSIWHFYDANTHTLFKGDGTEREVVGVVTSGITRVADESGGEVYYFDSTGKITQIKAGLTGTVLFTFTYDTKGRLKKITQPFSLVTTFTRNISGVLQSITAPNGAVTTVTINTNGYLEKITNPKSEEFTMTYYGTKGLLHTFSKPDGDVTTLAYDADGNLTGDTHTNGYALTLNKSDGQVTTTTAEGIVSVNSFEIYSKTETNSTPSGLVESITKNDTMDSVSSSLGSSWYNYTPDPRFQNQVKALESHSTTNFGSRSANYTRSVTLLNPDDVFSIDQLTEVETLGNSQTTSVYNGGTKTRTTTSKLGRTATQKIDKYERPVSVRKGALTPIAFTYSSDLLTKVSQGTRFTTFDYYPSKLLKTETNALGQIITYTYDDAHRLLTKTLPDSRVIHYSYDSNGNLTSITPPSRPAHTLTFGLNEKLESYHPPLLGGVANVNTEYQYDLDKRLKKIIRPDGEEINFNYNPTTALLSTATGSFGIITNNYNLGLLTSVSDQYGSNISLGYTGKTVSQSTLNAVDGAVYTYSRTPDATAGEKTGSETINGLGSGSAGQTIAYVYDDDEYLTGIGPMTLVYNSPNGLLTKTTLSKIKDFYTYNSIGEVTRYVVKNGTLVIYQYDLARDVLGRIIQKTELLNGITSVFDYSYDNAGRFIEVHKNNVLESAYSYDDNSNRTGGIIRGASTAASYDDQDRLISYNGVPLTYNANGELLTKGAAVLSYDVFGNLKQYTDGVSSLAYETDPLQRRLGQMADGVAASRLRYAYNPEGQVIGQLDYQNNLIKTFVYATKGHVPDFYIDSSNNKFRIITDHLGSVRMVVAAGTGAVLQIMEHDEFGVVLQDTSPGLQPFGFAGGLYNSATKLVRFGARDYDAETGRWTAKDPIGFVAGIRICMGMC
jgi:RHS repeat-associated protein